MVKSLIAVFCCFFSLYSFSQQGEFEKFPVFPECENSVIEQLEDCFQSTLRDFILQNFAIPEVVTQEAYRGQVVAEGKQDNPEHV